MFQTQPCLEPPVRSALDDVERLRCESEPEHLVGEGSKCESPWKPATEPAAEKKPVGRKAATEEKQPSA
ncbi:hypothetical protein STEG23_015920 [Scotinomys teguina]